MTKITEETVHTLETITNAVMFTNTYLHALEGDSRDRARGDIVEGMTRRLRAAGKLDDNGVYGFVSYFEGLSAAEKGEALDYVKKFAETRHRLVSMLYDQDLSETEADAVHDAFASADPDEE